MKDFRNKLAVITGGGTGMGRELARQLSAEGCHVAMCDVLSENMVETKRLCDVSAPAGVRVTTHPCDVSKEEEMIAFRDAVMTQHQTEHINLLFNNAGIGGGGSILNDERAERTRGVRASTPQLRVSAGTVGTSRGSGRAGTSGERLSVGRGPRPRKVLRPRES
jgi:NAD(P)-dependent dehydrogenase (short-subunit alcohol dehydrogenase family)